MLTCLVPNWKTERRQYNSKKKYSQRNVYHTETFKLKYEFEIRPQVFSKENEDKASTFVSNIVDEPVILYVLFRINSFDSSSLQSTQLSKLFPYVLLSKNNHIFAKKYGN